MSNAERIAALSDKLAMAADARHMATSPVWDEAWKSFERELLERLLKCEPGDDVPRYRLQVALEAARHVRRAIEHAGQTVSALENELDLLEGRKPYRVA